MSCLIWNWKSHHTMRVAIRSANDVYSVSWRGWRMGRALLKLKFKIEIPQKKNQSHLRQQTWNLKMEAAWKRRCRPSKNHNFLRFPAVHFQGCNFCYHLQPSKCWLLTKERHARGQLFMILTGSPGSMWISVNQWPGWSWLSDLLYRHITYHFCPQNHWKLQVLAS